MVLCGRSIASCSLFVLCDGFGLRPCWFVRVRTSAGRFCLLLPQLSKILAVKGNTSSNSPFDSLLLRVRNSKPVTHKNANGSEANTREPGADRRRNFVEEG